MGLTGRYDFKGIQKATRAIIDGLMVGTSWGAWILASPFKPVIGAIEDAIVNYLANRGLILLDIGLVMVDGKINQTKLDNALDVAFAKLQIGWDKITPEEGAKIDAETDASFDDFADVHANNPDINSVSNVSGAPVRDRLR